MDEYLARGKQPLQESAEERGWIIQHFDKHYQKHLFGLGILVGIGLFKMLAIIGTSLGINTAAEETKADYIPSAMETALETFNQIEELARQRDAFFHQKQKIYNYTGESLFIKTDNMFHILDNVYRAASGTEEKFELAKKLNSIINQENELFNAVQDINPDRNILLQELSQIFHDLQKQIANK